MFTPSAMVASFVLFFFFRMNFFVDKFVKRKIRMNEKQSVVICHAVSKGYSLTSNARSFYFVCSLLFYTFVHLENVEHRCG